MSIDRCLSRRTLMCRQWLAARRRLPRQRYASLFLSLVALLLLGACSPLGTLRSRPDAIGSCLDGLHRPAAVTTGIFVEPDDSRAPVLNELNAARCTLDVAVYILSDTAVIAALEAAEARGVRVRLILEEHPFGGGEDPGALAKSLRAKGVDVRWSDSAFRFTHAKYVVVDRRVAVIMNENLTKAAFTGNREYGVVSDDATAAADAQEIFDDDWAGRADDLAGDTLIVSPDNSRTRFNALIESAGGSIDFYAEVIRDTKIMDALATVAARGVQVRIITNPPADDVDRAVIAQLTAAGIDVRIAKSYYVHAKLMLVDGVTAIVGSQNFTPTSLDDNREVAMVVTDGLPVARCRSLFASDWVRATEATTGDTGWIGASGGA